MYRLALVDFCDPLPSGGHLFSPQRPLPWHFDTHLTANILSRFAPTVQRPPTPPPEMNTVASSLQPQRHQGYGFTYEQRLLSSTKQDEERYHTLQVSRPQQQGNGVQSAADSRTQSPPYHHNATASTGALSQRRNSHLDAIAPSLQIPSSINSSQGSLSELAAQVCDSQTLHFFVLCSYPSDHMLVLV